MSISIIIVNYNTTSYINRLVSSIRKFIDDTEYEIIIVDNNSVERDIEEYAVNNPDIKLVQLDQNYGFGYANNRGMENARYEYFLLLNPDTYLSDDSIKLLFKAFEKNLDWGIAAPAIKFPNGKIQESALKFPNIRYEIYSLLGILARVIKYSKRLRRIIFGNKEYETDFLFGSCLLIRKELNDILGGFDEDYFLFTEETDYCYRTKQETEYKIVYYPKACIHHESGAITKKNPAKREYFSYNSKLIFINKHYSKWYSILFRFVVIMLFLKKILAAKAVKSKRDTERVEYYSKIIRMYLTNSPELNNVHRER